MLPAAAFTDPRVLEWELEEIFGGWICAAHRSAVAEPGAYIARELGAESFFLLAGEDGEVRAFFKRLPPPRLSLARGRRPGEAADPLPLPRLGPRSS